MNFLRQGFRKLSSDRQTNRQTNRQTDTTEIIEDKNVIKLLRQTKRCSAKMI